MRLPCRPALLLACAVCLAGGSAHAAEDLFLERGSSGQARPPEGAAAPGPLVPAVRGLPPDPGGARTYRIAPRDLLKIRVFQVDELSGEARVDDQGRVPVPLIGSVEVAGLKPQEAADRLAAVLGRDYLQDPKVDVLVLEATRQRVTVMGSVNRPGIFPIAGQTTLLQAIALAEGTTALARESEVIVLRADPPAGGSAPGRGSERAYVVDLAAVKRGEMQDPILAGDDRVVVPRSGTAAFVHGVADTLRGFVRLPLF